MMEDITNWEDILGLNETKHIKCGGKDFYNALCREYLLPLLLL